MGSAPHFGNMYALFWTTINLLLPLLVILAVIWYVKQKRAYQRELLEKMDRLITVLEQKREK